MSVPTFLWYPGFGAKGLRRNIIPGFLFKPELNTKCEFDEKDSICNNCSDFVHFMF